MTKAAWFNSNGRFNFWDSDQQPGEKEIAEGYKKADIDENIALWRLTYNFETNVVDVYQPDMNDSDASAKQFADMEAADSDRRAAEAAAS